MMLTTLHIQAVVVEAVSRIHGLCFYKAGYSYVQRWGGLHTDNHFPCLASPLTLTELQAVTRAACLMISHILNFLC